MADYLLLGWEQIHRELFCDKNGKPVISLSTLIQKFGPDLKRLGVVFEWHLGRGKRRTMCGWRNMIINYFTALARRTEEEKRMDELLGNPMSEDNEP